MMSTLDTNAQAENQRSRPQHLGEILCQRGLLTEQQLQAALRYQRESAPDKLLGEILVEMELVDAVRVVEMMAALLDIPYVAPTPEMVEAEALATLPAAFVESHNLLPLSIRGGRLRVAVENFADVFLIEDIKRRSGLPVDVVAATPEQIAEVRRSVLAERDTPHDPAEGESGHSLTNIVDELAIDTLKVVEQEQQDNAAELEAAATDSPVVKLVNYIIHNGVDARASDIHIEPDDDCFRVRYRVDGELMEAVRPTVRLLPAVVSRIKIMSGMDISERRLPQDGGVTVMIGQRPIDLRVSTMASKLGEKVVMRIVDRSAAVQSLDTLGFDPGMLAQLRSAVQESHGIVLVTGPTGSGKSTTLYGALAELVTEKHNISTIEDPVERRLRGTNQFQVHNAAGFTFARALRALLRQDPDILMVGEIRDCETAKLATEAALTGHLVLSTLHTNDAPTAVPRLINMGVEPYLIAASLRAVLAQRLVRRICPHCREASEPTPAVREALKQMCGGQCPVDVVYHGAGCARCRGVGYFGRVGVFELLMLNEEMLAGIARDGSMRTVRELARRQGFMPMLYDGLSKVKAGQISVEGLLEVVSRSEEPDAPAAAGDEQR